MLREDYGCYCCKGYLFRVLPQAVVQAAPRVVLLGLFFLVAGKIFALSYKIIYCRNQLSRLLGCTREVGDGECSTEILGDLCGFLVALDESEIRLRSCLAPSDVYACSLVLKIEVEVECW